MSWFSFSTVITLAKRFLQIGVSDSASFERLKEEFQDFKLFPGDLPSVVKYKAADGVMRAKAGLFWSEINKMTMLDAQLRFSKLHRWSSFRSGLQCRLRARFFYVEEDTHRPKGKH